jgi:NAD(P)-dependent dehydrogenase (short-subunit alcohol dehydrogenase family)
MNHRKSIDIEGRTALITGASTGIGRAISELLATNGVNVLACARHKDDIRTLSEIPKIQGFRLDVKRIAEIKSIAKQLSEEGTNLFAIINNAGIAVGGPMLTLPENELRDCLEVNTIGPVNIVRELYPFLAEDGCIINISSIGARYITPWMAPYHMSKCALEAYTDALRMELSPFGTRVVIIEPGAVKTAAFTKWDRLLSHMQGTIYESAFHRYWNMITEQHKYALNPCKIAEVVIKVLRDPTPKKRYLIPHRPAVRAVILLATFGLSDLLYHRFLSNVRKVPPSYFRSQSDEDIA